MHVCNLNFICQLRCESNSELFLDLKKVSFQTAIIVSCTFPMDGLDNDSDRYLEGFSYCPTFIYLFILKLDLQPILIDL